jgi:hypothetical protein
MLSSRLLNPKKIAASAAIFQPTAGLVVGLGSAGYKIAKDEIQLMKKAFGTTCRTTALIC